MTDEDNRYRVPRFDPGPTFTSPSVPARARRPLVLQPMSGVGAVRAQSASITGRSHLSAEHRYDRLGLSVGSDARHATLARSGQGSCRDAVAGG